jgi:molybdopterin-guanine dinucleotide biosynthesis adapter protein
MESMRKKRLHVLGRKNHGKTTLVVDLVRRLTELGYRVGTIKHTHHQHELDTPGKDSHQHRIAGAAAVGILSPSLHAVFWPPVSTDSKGEERYTSFEPMFAHCDLVIVEGDTQTEGTKLEVWRSAVGSEPLAMVDASIVGIVTDDPCPASCRHFPRGDVTALLAWIQSVYPRS